MQRSAQSRAAWFDPALPAPHDASLIQPHMSYAVTARIEEGGKLLFINDLRYSVVTRGAPAHVDMVLRAAGTPRP